MTILDPFNGLFFQDNLGKPAPERILDFNEARDDGVAEASAGPYAPHSWQITMPVPHHSIFTGRMPFLSSSRQCQSIEVTAYHCKLGQICNSPEAGILAASLTALVMSHQWLRVAISCPVVVWMKRTLIFCYSTENDAIFSFPSVFCF